MGCTAGRVSSAAVWVFVKHCEACDSRPYNATMAEWKVTMIYGTLSITGEVDWCAS